MLYVLAQVYDRELGDVAKAIETYQGILDIDADELPAIQSLDRLYGQAERWYDLLGNVARQAAPSVPLLRSASPITTSRMPWWATGNSTRPAEPMVSTRRRTDRRMWQRS